ncbi:MAG: spore coat protein [Bacillota bacterium]|uniref:spore coat protein n=1 Tax=unclassified Candidatus Desulforudis TaxID=2635950 RepID=UPI00346E916F
MQLGMHEAMELHEVLSGKVNMIDHHALYISEAQDPQLRSLLERHQQWMLQDYQKTLNYLQGRGVNVSPYHIRNVGTPTYGAQGGQTVQPHPNTRRLSDQAICTGALMLHKCGASTATVAALEAADPELRLMLTNDILSCVNMAYEIFQYMNQRGYYQVPTVDRRTMQNIANTYSGVGGQPMVGQQFPGQFQFQQGTYQGPPAYV